MENFSHGCLIMNRSPAVSTSLLLITYHCLMRSSPSSIFLRLFPSRAPHIVRGVYTQYYHLLNTHTPDVTQITIKSCHSRSGGR